MSFVGMLAATLLSCLIVCEQKASTKDMGKRKTDEEFKKELKEKFPQIKPKGVYINGTKKIPFECMVDGFEWDSTPNNALKYGCSCCNGHYMNDYMVYSDFPHMTR